MSDFVHIIEVGPRDGFQRLEKIIPAGYKATLIHQLVQAGLRRIQATSFVHPKIVPQMADAEAVCAKLEPHDSVSYSGLVLNMRGLQRAHTAGIKHIEMGVPASETLCQRNVRYTIAQGMTLMKQMVDQAHDYGMSVRVGVQAAFGCAFEGHIAPKKVLDMAEQFLAMGIEELALADSAGLGNPRQVGEITQATLSLAGDVPVVLHLHDTRGQGLANLYSALEAGARHFDTSLGGLGGCPFIQSAKGNIATEDTAHMLHEMGLETGIDVAKVARVSRELETFLGIALPAKMHHLV